MFSAHGQNSLSIGIHIKPQANTFIGKNDILGSRTQNRIAKISLAGEISLSYDINNRLSILSGLGYQPQGVKEESLTLHGPMYFKTDINYVRFPVELGIRLMNTGKFNVDFNAGIGLNCFLNAKDNLAQVIGLLVSTIIEESEKDRYNKLVIDTRLSLGADYPVARDFCITGNLEFIQGLSRVHKKYSVGTHDVKIDSRMNSLGMAVGINYTF